MSTEFELTPFERASNVLTKTPELQRPETGAMQFGDDWPGIFIRGDQAFALKMALENALSECHGMHPLREMELQSFVKLLASCDARTNPECQKARLDCDP